MDKRKLLKSPKPYGYIEPKDLSEEQVESLRSIFGSEYAKYLDIENVSIIDYQTLSKIDNTVKYNFEYEFPLDHLFSIVDWTTHEMMSSRRSVLEHFFKESNNYFIIHQQRLFDINIFNLVWKNFLIYSQLDYSKENTGSSYVKMDDQKIYERVYAQLPSFTEICIKSYCFQNVRHKVPRAAAISLDEQNDLIQKWKSLFIESYNTHKDLLTKSQRTNLHKTGVDLEWSRQSMLFLVEFLSCHTKLDFKKDDDVLDVLMKDINPMKDELVSKYDYILMKMLNLKTSSASKSFMHDFITSIPKDIFEKFAQQFIKYDIKDSKQAMINLTPYLYPLINVNDSNDVFFANVMSTQDKIFIETVMKRDEFIDLSIKDLKSIIDKNTYFSNQNRYLEKLKDDTTGYFYQHQLLQELEGYRKYNQLDKQTKKKSVEDEKKIVKI